MKPFLKWAGGKTWLALHLRDLYAPHRARRWVEPFCGALGATFGTQPERALLNDANPHLVACLRSAKDGWPHPLPTWPNTPEQYAEVRARFNASGDPYAFYWLNRHGFNGLCRFNRSGEFNVPYGKYASPKVLTRDEWAPYRPAMQRWELTVGDFAALPVEADDFLYADPPYDGTWGDYAAGGFTWADQVRLADWLAAHLGPVVVSNSATDRILAIYAERGFDVGTMGAPRRIACNGDRAPAREMLATRGVVAAAVAQPSLDFAA